MDKKNVEKVMQMMRDRANYWADRHDCERHNRHNAELVGEAYGRADAYDTCAYFLDRLLADDWETLRQFDYYEEN